MLSQVQDVRGAKDFLGGRTDLPAAMDVARPLLLMSSEDARGEGYRELGEWSTDEADGPSSLPSR